MVLDRIREELSDGRCTFIGLSVFLLVLGANAELFFSGMSMRMKGVTILPPIEETIKLLSLVVFSYALRDREESGKLWILLVIIGGVFAVVEHFIAYSDESTISFAMRALMHPSYMFVGRETSQYADTLFSLNGIGFWLTSATLVHTVNNWIHFFPRSLSAQVFLQVLTLLFIAAGVYLSHQYRTRHNV